jgi:hypothetical protein
VAVFEIDLAAGPRGPIGPVKVYGEIPVEFRYTERSKVIAAAPAVDWNHTVEPQASPVKCSPQATGRDIGDASVAREHGTLEAYRSLVLPCLSAAPGRG